MKAMDYLQSKYISPYKGNEKSNLYNSSTIIDEIWSKKIPFHDRTGLGYQKDEEVEKGIPMSKFEEGSSSSKRQRVITNQIPDQNSAMRMNYRRKRIKHEAHQKGSLSYHTNTWYGTNIQWSLLLLSQTWTESSGM